MVNSQLGMFLLAIVMLMLYDDMPEAKTMKRFVCEISAMTVMVIACGFLWLQSW